MAQLGSFRAIARIYTNTPEAQTILQQLRELFQDAEEKNAVSQEDVVWSEFSEDVQPDYTEYHPKSGYSCLCRWLTFQISGILRKIEALHNGSYALMSGSADLSSFCWSCGAVSSQKLPLSEYNGKTEWGVDDAFTAEITMKLKGWMELFQTKKENVLAHMIKYYSCSWVFDEKTIKILKGKNPDSFIEELYYMRGEEEYLIFDSGVFLGYREPNPQKRYVPFDQFECHEEDRIRIEVRASMYNFTKDTITFVREDFYDSLEFLQQFDKDALLQMHFVNVIYDDFDNAIYRNEMTGDFTTLRFRTGVNWFEEPVVEVPLIGTEPTGNV